MLKWLRDKYGTAPCLGGAGQAKSSGHSALSTINDTSNVEAGSEKLLLELPGPAWATLWASLPANDQLHLFQLCRGTRDRVLSSHMQSARFTVPKDAQLSSAVRALLQRSQPLGKLTLAGAPGSIDNAAAVTSLLQEVASGHAAAQAGGLEPWNAAASLHELELRDVNLSAEAAALLPQAFPQLSTLRLIHCRQHTPAVVKALRSCQHLTHLTMHDTHVDSCIAGGAESGKAVDAAALWEAAVAEVSASGDGAVLQAVAAVRDSWTDGAGLRAAATGLLLSQLTHLTSLDLQMPQSVAALSLIVLTLGPKLTALSLSDWGLSTQPPEVLEHLKKALQACSSLSSLELMVGVEKQMPAVLAALPAPANLRRLSVRLLIVTRELFDLLLEKLPGLEHLTIQCFKELQPSRATAPCPWRTLELMCGAVSLRELAYLPLHSLSTLKVFDQSREGCLQHYGEDPEEAAALVEAAQANLARCKPGLISAGPLQSLVVEHRTSCGKLLSLLAFFPSVEKLVLRMVTTPLGKQDLEGLAQAGSFALGVQELEVEALDLEPGFITSALWSVLPAVITLRFDVLCGASSMVGRVVAVFAAAPHPVSVQGPWFGNRKLEAELKKKLLALPGGKVKVM